MSRSRDRRREQAGETSLESRLFKFGTKLVLGVFIAVMFLTLTQCTVKKPEAPTWTTQFTLPLVNRTYEMSEIISKMGDDDLQITADSAVVYTLTRDIDTVAIDSDELSTSDLSYDFSEQLGTIEIDAPAADSSTVALADISDLTTYLPGTVPATSFSVDNSMTPISTFSTATVANGQITAVSTNNLGFDLSSATVQLYDVVNARTIDAPKSFPGGLLDGETDSVVFDLSGETLSNSLEVRLAANTLGGTVLSLSEKEIVTAINFGGNLTVSAAVAEIPALSRDLSESIALTESGTIHSAELSSGQLHLDIANETSLPADLDIRFPDILSDGSPLVVERTISANSSTIVTVSLIGCELNPEDLSVPQNINVEATAEIAGTGPGQQASVAADDRFTISADLTNLTFASVSGVFDTVRTTIEPTTEEIEVPDGLDQMELVAAILTLDIDNGVDMPGTLVVTLQGNNGKTLTLSGDIAAGSPTAPVTSSIMDSSVADFLNPIPTEVDISGEAAFGDGSTVSTITANDFLFARINIVAPLEVIVHASSVESDVEDTEIEQDDIDAVTDHVVEARLHYNVVSHFPIGAEFAICLSSDSSTVYSAPELQIDGISFDGAPTTAGIVSEELVTGYQQIILSNDDVQILKNDTLYIGTLLMLEDTNGQPVRLTAGDYITLTGHIEIDYLFDGEF